MSVTPLNEYRVMLDVFEGPLDLLLYLIRKDEVNIYDIPIERITQQYMDYLDLMRMLDLNIAGEFLVMASTLLLIKSRTLLPVEERAPEGDEDEDDPRWDLVRQLVEYKKFKDAALHLQTLEEHQENVFMRTSQEVDLPPEADLALQDVSIFDLISAFNDALSKVQKEELREIFSERFTVGEKVDDILRRLSRAPRLSLTELFSGMRSRHEVVCAFLAVLELIRLKQARAIQDEAYGPILLDRIVDG